MDIFLGVSFAIVIVLGYLFFTDPARWHHHIKWLPIAAFIITARAYGMSPEACHNAFVLAGFTAIFILVVLWHQQVRVDRLLLGANLFFVIGAYGFISGDNAIVDWYAASIGGPLFTCIIVVGLLATLFTKPGFIGIKKKIEVTQYSSFLLLAATVIALIWSIRVDERGPFFAVVIPFILLLVIRDQLIRMID